MNIALVKLCRIESVVTLGNYCDYLVIHRVTVEGRGEADPTAELT